MTIETIEYGEVDNSLLLIIFGDEMTYNELKFYAKNKDETTHLKVEWNRNDLTQLVRVWFNAQLVMDKQFGLNYSCDMFYHLNELPPQEEEEECCGKHCDCTEGLKLAMGWNRYYASSEDMIMSQLFCEYCIDDYTTELCKGCSNKYLYTEMHYKKGGAFGDEMCDDAKRFFCKKCVADIESIDYDADEYIDINSKEEEEEEEEEEDERTYQYWRNLECNQYNDNEEKRNTPVTDFQIDQIFCIDNKFAKVIKVTPKCVKFQFIENTRTQVWSGTTRDGSLSAYGYYRIDANPLEVTNHTALIKKNKITLDMHTSQYYKQLCP